jgi:hypothetical protein
MDLRRDRSPSQGHHHHITHSTSTDPHSPLNAAAPDQTSPFTAHAHSPGHFSDPTFTTDFSQQAHFGLDPSYGNLQSQNQYNNLSDQSGNSAFPAFDFNHDTFHQNTSLDPNILDNFDPSSLELFQQQTGANHDGNTLDPMATVTQSHSPTPPHLFAQSGCRPSGSPSPHASPSFANAQYQAMNRPRNHSESLDPSSALFPQGGNEWMGMGAYRSHKRTPSDNLSDISSNHASPYMATLDNFEHSSPLLNPLQDPSFNDALGLQQFTLNDQHNHFSPAHSPGHSPHLMPQSQHALPQFTPDNNFGLSSNINGQFGHQNGGMDMFAGNGQEPFPSLGNDNPSPGQSGLADHMSPPEINIDFAPPSRVPTVDMKLENSADALSPPLRSKSHSELGIDCLVANHSCSKPRARQVRFTRGVPIPVARALRTRAISIRRW